MVLAVITGSGREITIRKLAEEVAAAIDDRTPQIQFHDPRPGDVLRLFADAGAARERLGFRPVITLREGLAHLQDWYLAGDDGPETLLNEEIVHNWR